MILENRVAIVTGAGSGIGQAAALIIAREGAVGGVADRSPDSAARTVALIAAMNGRAAPVIFDLTDDTALAAAFAPFLAQIGGRENVEAYIRDKVPIGRWALVDEIAAAVLFLVSDRSSYMTGQILVVDGGETVV